jgi:hypothetical protein
VAPFFFLTRHKEIFMSVLTVVAFRGTVTVSMVLSFDCQAEAKREFGASFEETAMPKLPPQL